MAIPKESWHGLYAQKWGDYLTPASSDHPAKMARQLTYRILREGLARSWWNKDTLILDPFGGVGCTGIAASDLGLRSLLVELEDHWVQAARRNFTLHRKSWAAIKAPEPVIVRGDSRHLASLVRQHAGRVGAGILTSPPYGNRLDDSGTGPLADANGRYGSDPWQIGNLRVGIVTSPPFGDPSTRDRSDVQSGTISDVMARSYVVSGQSSPGNIASLPLEKGKGKREESGEDYWQACTAVYRQMGMIMGPSSHAAIVVKGFVKDGQYVDIPQQTIDCLKRVGLMTILRIQAMQVADATQGSLLPDVVPDYIKSHKSAMRRLQEKKGGSSIDYEEVLICKKEEDW